MSYSIGGHCNQMIKDDLIFLFMIIYLPNFHKSHPSRLMIMFYFRRSYHYLNIFLDFANFVSGLWPCRYRSPLYTMDKCRYIYIIYIYLHISFETFNDVVLSPQPGARPMTSSATASSTASSSPRARWASWGTSLTNDVARHGTESELTGCGCNETCLDT